MHLVVLAAGHGRRFGGHKQLAAVGPHGEAIMDYTARSALRAGFDRAVLIVREDVRDELSAHVAARWPPGLEVTAVLQGPIPGTAQAVASASGHVKGSFAVVNADDLYGDEAVEALAAGLPQLGAGDHLAVTYELARTILTDAPVTRGICATNAAGDLERVVEMTVTRRPGGFEARPVGTDGAVSSSRLEGREAVSMNLWGFSEGIFAELEASLAAFDPPAPSSPGAKPPELLLPSVVADLVARGRCRVRTVPTKSRCIGITHPDDLPLVRRIVAEREAS